MLTYNSANLFGPNEMLYFCSQEKKSWPPSSSPWLVFIVCLWHWTLLGDIVCLILCDSYNSYSLHFRLEKTEAMSLESGFEFCTILLQSSCSFYHLIPQGQNFLKWTLMRPSLNNVYFNDYKQHCIFSKANENSNIHDSRKERCNKSGADSHLFIAWFIRAKKLEVCSRWRPIMLSLFPKKKKRKKLTAKPQQLIFNF